MPSILPEKTTNSPRVRRGRRQARRGPFRTEGLFVSDCSGFVAVSKVLSGGFYDFERLSVELWQDVVHKERMTGEIQRTPWPPNFPDVVIHMSLKARNRHPAYPAAKAGDATAAYAFVSDVLNAENFERVAALIVGRKPLLAPVAAVEAEGFNAIPDAMAQLLAGKLGLSMADYDLRQSNYVGHTGADGWLRLATPATFTGSVEQGKDYLLIDDHVGLGGTLANLRGYIEGQGGRVIGMTTLTETAGGHKITSRPETLSVLETKHGQELNQFWNGIFGYSTACLTDIEAGYLSRVESVAAIKTRLAQAATFARGRGISPIELQP